MSRSGPQTNPGTPTVHAVHAVHAAREERPRTGDRRSWAARLALGVGGLVAVAGAAMVVALVFGRPSVSVSSSGEALFTVHVNGVGTRLRQVHATADGRPLTLRPGDGGFVPTARLPQGQPVEVRVMAEAPSWLRWLVGGTVTTAATVRCPKAVPAAAVVVAASAHRVPVRFDGSVRTVTYAATGGPSHVVHLRHAATVVDLQVPATIGGSLRLQADPRTWEQPPTRTSSLTWFVSSVNGEPSAVASPAPGSATASSNGPITLTFDRPVSKLLGSRRPTLSPAVQGTWRQPSPYELVFTPSGFGFGPGTSVTVDFGRPVAVATGATVTTAAAAATYSFQVAPGSLLRMEQLLAQLHYLPLRFTPAPGAAVPTTFTQEVATLSQPLPGTFSWRWSSTPATLQAQWVPGSPNVLVKGALMAFESSLPTYDGYALDSETVTQMATSSTWEALAKAAATKQLDPSPYSYVYVSKALPETLTLWENGANVLTALTNTGIVQDPTTDGTFPIYVRFTVNYMNGTNPNGTTYHDLVHWINYFHGGQAVHGFVRASYGFPQSLGCVELPVATAQVAFSDLAIGDLVTVAG